MQPLSDTHSMTVATQYFGTLRDEIHLRIKEHIHLVWIKLAVAGVMFSFMITKFPGKNESAGSLHYCLWIVPLAAVVFDVLIAGNLRVIYNLGHYIKNYLEGDVFPGIRGRLLHTLPGNAKSETIDKLHDAATSGVVKSASTFAGLQAALNKGRVRVAKWEAKVHERGPNEWKLVCSQMSPAFWGNAWSWLRYELGMGGSGDRGVLFIITDGADGLQVYCSSLAYWEETAAQAAPKYRCYTWLDMLAIWSFTLGCWVITLLVRWEQMGMAEILLAGLCGVFAGSAVIGLIRSIRMKRAF